MRVDLHLYIEPGPEVTDRLDAIAQKLDLVLEKEDTIMSALDDLTAQVSANRTVLQSALALINGIAARITAAGTDPAALSALTASLKADDDQLAAAVVANTPAATPPAP